MANFTEFVPEPFSVSASIAGLGLRAGDPVFLAPDFTVDLDLLDFVRSNDFRWLERETKRNYATDVRLLLDFLWSRDVQWREASERDLADYRAWRCQAPENVAGSEN